MEGQHSHSFTPPTSDAVSGGSTGSRYKLMSPAKLPISRTTSITIPPGLSPTSFLESPVLLSNIKNCKSCPVHPVIQFVIAEDDDTYAPGHVAEFFPTEPCACEPSSLPESPPSKESDVKQRDLSGKAQAVDGTRKVPRYEISRAIPAPEANAELETSLDVSGNIHFMHAHTDTHIGCQMPGSFLFYNNYVACLFTTFI